MKTAQGLSNHAIARIGQGYIRGTYGQVCTLGLRQQKVKQFNNAADTKRIMEVGKKWDSIRVRDCIGLMKEYMWIQADGSIPRDQKSDWDTEMLFNRVPMGERKGLIAGIPEMPGIVVYKVGHVGVYIGAGYVVEARGTSDGVVKTPIKGTGSTKWTHWIMYPGIEYGDSAGVGVDVDMIKKGSKGVFVIIWQNLLKIIGFDIGEFLDIDKKPTGIDGSFGGVVEGATIEFQKKYGFKGDGIVDYETIMKALELTIDKMKLMEAEIKSLNVDNTTKDALIKEKSSTEADLNKKLILLNGSLSKQNLQYTNLQAENDKLKIDLRVMTARENGYLNDVAKMQDDKKILDEKVISLNKDLLESIEREKTLKQENRKLLDDSMQEENTQNHHIELKNDNDADDLKDIDVKISDITKVTVGDYLNSLLKNLLRLLSGN